MGKVSRTYRLSQETIDELDKLANDSGVTATEALTRAIHSAATVEYGCNTESEGAKDAETAREMQRMAERRADEMAAEVERLHAALERAQDTTKAAQVLQQQAEHRAAEAKAELAALPAPDSWKEKPLLDRIFKR